MKRIFNAEQTKQIFEKGKIAYGSRRGKALASGTAFADGTLKPSGRAFSKGGKVGRYTVTGGGTTSGTGTGGTGGTGGGSSNSDEFSETFDWIEIAIDRIERALSNLGVTIDSVYETWGTRNSAINKSITNTQKELDLQYKGQQRYLKQANKVKFTKKQQHWKAKVRQAVEDGYTIDISTIENESLAKKIKEYQEWYQKAIDCRDAIKELQESLKEFYSTKFENVVTKWENALARLEHRATVLEERISKAEAKGQIVDASYYQTLIDEEKKQKNKLIAQRQEMYNALNAAVASGAVKVGSEEWSNMVNQINEVSASIAECDTNMAEYNKTMKEAQWSLWDKTQERISAITTETEFLIELMSNKKLYDDNGQLTDEGLATMGLYAENYDVEMKKAQEYRSYIDEMEKQLAADPSLAKDQDFLDKMQEYKEAEQEAILAAEENKTAIRDMVEEGINIELEALQERIDKHNESLQSMKDLYDYQKKVKKQTKDIASLEKQMAAYAGDDSEEAKAKIQELKVSLEEAKADLEETEYDKYVSDQEELLDDLYTEYEDLLNSRLDNIDALFEDMIGEVNSSSKNIADTIEAVAKKVGYDISAENDAIWNGKGDVVSSDTGTDDTTTDKTVGGVTVPTTTPSTSTPDAGNTDYAKGTANYNNKVVDLHDKVDLKKNYNYYSSSTATKKKGTTKKKNKGMYVTYIATAKGTKNPYRLSYTKKGVYNNGKSSTLGWVKKAAISGYATGAEDLLKDEIAWTQEKGREFIVRPSDGAILTPLAKGDSVLNADASNNIWDMANNPADFIRGNLGFDEVASSTSNNAQNTIINNLDNVTFSLPSVTNYDEFVQAMVKDKNVERYVKSITTDLLVGKSKLAKGKSIR